MPVLQLPASCSIDQWLSVWDDLTRAYFGKNGFGGNTAEIYAYRFFPYSPRESSVLTKEETDEQNQLAKEAFTLIVQRFMHQWNCEVSIDGLEWFAWFLKDTFDYRCAVQVIPNP